MAGEDPPVCISCQENLTVEHILTHCAEYSFILSSQKYTEYLLLVINIVFIRYIFNELYAYIIYYL